MTNAYAILEARWAVLHALVDKMRAENDAELARLKEALAERCREYNAAVVQHNQLRQHEAV